jgi:hypothetical protein
MISRGSGFIPVFVRFILFIFWFFPVVFFVSYFSVVCCLLSIAYISGLSILDCPCPFLGRLFFKTNCYICTQAIL